MCAIHDAVQALPYPIRLTLPKLSCWSSPSLPVLMAFSPSDNVRDELVILSVYGAAVVFTYFRYILFVINEICSHLDIKCLTITTKA